MAGKKLSIQSSIFWNSAGSIFYLGCQWLLTVIVVRISSVDSAGVLSLAMSACNIWYCLAVYGMRNFQVSDTNDKYQSGTYIYSRILTCAMALFGCLLYITVISYDFEQKACILFYLCFKFSEAWFDVYAGIFQKKWRLDYAGKSMMLRGVLSLVSFTLVLKLSGNMVLTIFLMAVICIAAVIIYDVPAAKKIEHIAVNTDRHAVKSLLIECFPLVIYTLLSSVIGTIPRLYMERLMSSYSLGIYSSVATPTLIIQMGATYVFNPFVTLFAERFHDGERKKFLSALYKCAMAVFAIAVIGIVGGEIFGVWGLRLLYGDEVASHSQLLMPLIICTILTAFSWLLCGVLTAIREFRGLIIGNLSAVAASCILSPFLEKAFDMQGASYALGLATLIEIIILCIYIVKNVRDQL